jgi:hypothetical protein
MQNEQDKYLGEYSEILSYVHTELGNDYDVLINPTISKQETVTGLYKTLDTNIAWHFTVIGINLLVFPIRFFWHLINLNIISLLLKVKYFPENSTYFRTWLVPRSFLSNTIQDDYFRFLPLDLPANENAVVGFQPQKYGLIWKFFVYNKNDKFIIPSGLLNNFEITYILIKFFVCKKRLVRKSYFFRDKSITANINISLINDFLKMRSFQGFLEKEICRKLLQKRIKKFVYIFENQSWEKVACKVFQEASVTTIGYQSSGFSPLFLNFFPNKLDFEIQYQPDVLLTVGDGFKKYLTENAFYKSKISSFAALRFDHPKDNLGYLVKAPITKLHNQVLYAFPVHLNQYQFIIEKLMEEFSETDIEVHLKFHPLAEKLHKKWTRILPHNFRCLENLNVAALRDSYDAIFFNDNSFGIEALFHGVKCFELDLFNNTLDERLFYFNDWKARISLDEFSKIKNDLVLGKHNKSFDIESVKRYLNYMYNPYDKTHADILAGIS